MMVDRNYCMSSYLMYRMVVSDEYSFSEKIIPKLADITFPRRDVFSSDDLVESLCAIMDDATRGGDAALALSGGIDSAILASMMPEGSTAYTFRCIVPGIDVIDETAVASKIAKKFNLKHEIIDIYWDDVVKSLCTLMENKGAPIHSIESQIYIAGLRCKADGFSKMIFGENADIIYGGMDGLLKKDWTFGEYVDRYSYVMPYHVLYKPLLILEPYLKYEKNGLVDSYAFTNEYFRREALGTYNNACECAGIEFVGPYSKTKMACPVDLERIRSGESKYLVRGAYHSIFGDSDVIPPKIPMPRPTTEWLKQWAGPTRPEFIGNCVRNLSGDQRWMVYCLEQFLNMIDKMGC